MGVSERFVRSVVNSDIGAVGARGIGVWDEDCEM